MGFHLQLKRLVRTMILVLLIQVLICWDVTIISVGGFPPAWFLPIAWDLVRSLPLNPVRFGQANHVRWKTAFAWMITNRWNQSEYQKSTNGRRFSSLFEKRYERSIATTQSKMSFPSMWPLACPCVTTSPTSSYNTIQGLTVEKRGDDSSTTNESNVEDLKKVISCAKKTSKQ